MVTSKDLHLDLIWNTKANMKDHLLWSLCENEPYHSDQHLHLILSYCTGRSIDASMAVISGLGNGLAHYWYMSIN